MDADAPDLRPTMTVTIAYPEDLSERDAADGLGMELSMVAQYMTGEVVLLSLLRAVEAVASQAIRETREESASKLIPRDHELEHTLTAMNARLMAISAMSEMSLTPNDTMGFSI